MDKKTDFLSAVEIFKGVTKDDLQDIALILNEKTVSEDEIIFSEDEHGNQLFLLMDGSVKISIRPVVAQKNENMVKMIRPGEIFGEFSFIDERRRSASATALVDSRMLIFSRSDFDAISQKNPYCAIAILQNIARILTARLRETNMIWRSNG